MTDFNTKPLEQKLNQLGKEIQSFFENLVTEEDLDVFSPKADFVQTSEGFEIYADLPGMTKKDIKVELAENILTIKGERQIFESADHTSWLRRERHFGRFSRSFPIPVSIQKSDIKASFKDGVLTVVVHVTDSGTDAASIDID